MAIEVVLGCQGGDEGKGKVVQLLAQGADWVARFQGGANAGHTIFVGGRRLILHQIPSGIVEPRARCAIGNGVVLDPLALAEEIAGLEAIGIEVRPRLTISPFAHLVTPLHKAAERLGRQDRAIGTTGRGIGPAYAEKASRSGLRVEDLLDPGRLGEGLDALRLRLRSEHGLGDAALDEAVGSGREDIRSRLEAAGRTLAPLVGDVSALLLESDDRGERILCEGAQGALLDIDHGTYPFVTSSSTTIGGVCTGLGIPPRRIGRVVGVVKAYATRVGLGPFPTEMEPGEADRFRERAGEYGATTGRPRRCGWYDALLARRCCRINGVDELFVTKLDVLGGIGRLRLAVAYEGRPGEAPDAPPGEAGGRDWLSSMRLERARPRYRDFPGWRGDLQAAARFESLPPEARAYLAALSAETGVPIGHVSIGPGRDQVLAVTAG